MKYFYFILIISIFFNCKKATEINKKENFYKNKSTKYLENLVGKNFYSINYETKDSLIIGDFSLNKTNVIGILSKDTLFYANNMDGGYLRIEKFQKKEGNTYSFKLGSFDKRDIEKKELLLMLKDKNEGVWYFDKGSFNFYEANFGQFYLEKNKCDSLLVEKVDPNAIPDAFNLEEDLYYYYRLKSRQETILSTK